METEAAGVVKRRTEEHGRSVGWEGKEDRDRMKKCEVSEEREKGLVLILLGAGKAGSFSTAVLIFSRVGASPSPLIIP